MVSEQASLVWTQLLYLSLVHLISVGGAIKPPVVGLFVNSKLECMCMETVVLIILLPS